MRWFKLTNSNKYFEYCKCLKTFISDVKEWEMLFLMSITYVINSFESFHILYWRLPSKMWVRPTIPTLVPQQQFVNLEEPGQMDIYQEIKSAQWRGIEYFSATKGTKHKKQTNTEYRFYYTRRRMYRRKNVNEKLIKIWGWTEQQEVILGIFFRNSFSWLLWHSSPIRNVTLTTLYVLTLVFCHYVSYALHTSLLKTFCCVYAFLICTYYNLYTTYLLLCVSVC